MRIELPDGPSGEWREVLWQNGDTARELEKVTMEVDPPTAFREFRVYRTEGTLVANGSWDQSRSRGIQVRPANLLVLPNEELRVRAIAWWPRPVQLTAVFEWKGSV